jgi:subtilase family serine protease
VPYVGAGALQTRGADTVNCPTGIAVDANGKFTLKLHQRWIGMKTIGSQTRYGLLVAVIMLAGCGGAQSGSKLADGIVPAVNSNMTAGLSPEHGKVTAVCPDRHPGRAQCMALIFNGTPIRDGGSGPLGGFAPADLQAAYHLPSTSKSSGQIVAIVNWYDNPNVASDLAFYRSYFGLPAANFFKYNQYGQQYNYPQGDKSRGFEADLDVEMVSASCPNCTIYLVEANSNSVADAETAEAEAVTLGAHIVSNSWNCFGGACNDMQSYFDTAGVTYLAAAGDSSYGTTPPMDFGTVVSVGGTHLVKGGGKRGWTESVWGGTGIPSPAPGTGGGCSDQPKPSWQHDAGCAFRTANDVSAVADGDTGVSQYDTYGYSGWDIAGGTSVATPLVAGIFGLAGNATSQDGGKTFWEKIHERPSDLNPILRGSNGHCSPTYLCTDGTHEYKNYGGPTGWGTPNGIGAF